MDHIFDIAIIGCGPAGLSAAINARIRNKDIVLLGSSPQNSNLFKSPRIDNYLGFHGMTGQDMISRFIEHASGMGIEVTRAKVTNIYPGDGIFSILAGNDFFQSKSIILATGVSQAKTIPGEKELVGFGVSYCATCDGPLYKGKTVAVTADHREAEEEVSYLAELAASVMFFPAYKDVGELPANVTVQKGKIEAVAGGTKIEAIKVSGETISVDGLFVLRQTVPAEQLVPGLEMADGAIVVDRNMSTNIEGVFAAGDCTGRPWQLSKAAGEGQIAGLSAVKYLSER